MIFSNYGALYMDCGFGAWYEDLLPQLSCSLIVIIRVGEGNNWCSPYKEWQRVYKNDPYELLEKRYVVLTEDKKKQVRGAEVAIWSEQVKHKKRIKSINGLWTCITL